MKKAIIYILAVLTVSGLSVNGQPPKGASQFLLSEFAVTNVLLKNGQTKKMLMNYNIISGTMMISQNNKLFNLTNPELADTVYFGTRKFVAAQGCFLEYLGNDLFVQTKGSLMSPPKQAGYGSTSQTASVTSLTTVSENPIIYDFKLPDGYSVDITVSYRLRTDEGLESFVNERQLIKILPSKETAIKTYSKTNKTDFKKSEEVLRLLVAVMSGN
jgi:hypothetical protein